jgi:hypothetical protein
MKDKLLGLFGDIDHLVIEVRKRIVVNKKKRFKKSHNKYGYKHYVYIQDNVKEYHYDYKFIMNVVDDTLFLSDGKPIKIDVEKESDVIMRFYRNGIEVISKEVEHYYEDGIFNFRGSAEITLKAIEDFIKIIPSGLVEVEE